MPGDELDIERPEELAAYLVSHGHVAADEALEQQTLAGGVSNRTVLVTRPSGEAWVVKQALNKLRVAVDWFSRPERIHREADGIHWLAKWAARGSIPGLIFIDRTAHILAMEAVPMPHQNWKNMLLDGQVRNTHFEQFGRLLGQIHAKAAVSTEAATQFADYSFFESLRLEPYYAYTAQQLPAAAAFLNKLIAETKRRRLTVVHGDFSPKNVLIRDGAVILLDHEVIHFGDPAFDIGFAMAHFLSKIRHLPEHRGKLIEGAQRFVACYLEETASVEWRNDLEPYAVRHSLACLLARVRGRSPLEYLDATAQEEQVTWVLNHIANPPNGLLDLIDTFRKEV